MPLQIVRLPVLDDNYVWLVHDPDTDETAAVDPAVAGPVLDAAAARGWHITQIWNTHWHGDHTGGNADIKAATGCLIVGPAGEADRIPTLDRFLAEGDTVSLGSKEAQVLEVPGHTSGHIAFYLPTAGALFCGDTLFAMGCGRLFEGTAAQMFDNMRRLSQLPDETAVYCAHEYTQSNGRFARAIEPDNPAIERRMADVDAMRARNEATIPSNIALERETNPFMRARSVEELAERRAAKDNFRG